MLFPTHFIGGALAALYIAPRADPVTTLVAAAAGALAALLPDIDSPESFLGSRIPVLPSVVRMTVGHRGPLHSLVCAGVVLLLASMFLKSGYAHLIPMIVAGYLSHLVMDSLNPQGVPWLWPMRKHFGLPLVQTGSLLERLVVTPAMVLLVVWLAATKLWL